MENLENLKHEYDKFVDESEIKISGIDAKIDQYVNTHFEGQEINLGMLKRKKLEEIERKHIIENGYDKKDKIDGLITSLAFIIAGFIGWKFGYPHGILYLVLSFCSSISIIAVILGIMGFDSWKETRNLEITQLSSSFEVHGQQKKVL